MGDSNYIVPSYQCNPTNLRRSVADWLFGTYAATGATIKDSAGAQKRFTQLHSTASLVQHQLPGDADLSIDDLLINTGSPVLAFSPPVMSTDRGFYGSMSWLETWVMEFDVYVTVYRTGGQRRRDGQATIRQMSDVLDEITRLLRYHDGHCPLRDYVAAQAAGGDPTTDTYDLGNILVEPMATIPRPTDDVVSFTLALTVLREAD